MLDIVLIILGFALLIAGASVLVDGSASFARRLRVPDLVIGLTIVAFGTSAPELIVNVIASLNHETDVSIGNVIGSNILNIALILGLSAMIRPPSVHISTILYEIPLTFLAAAAVMVLGNDMLIDGQDRSFLSRSDGIILLLFFAVFLYYTVNMALKSKDVEEGIPSKNYSVSVSLIMIAGGLALLVGGGHLIVQSSVNFAKSMGISERIISLTIVSLGTSLPELATSVVAARKGNSDLAVGNVVGSNIFNVLFILGISSLITELPVKSEFIADFIVNMIVSVLLFIFAFTGKEKRIDRMEGTVLFTGYALYIAFLILFR